MARSGYLMTAKRKAALKRWQAAGAAARARHAAKKASSIAANDLVKVVGRVSGKGSVGRVVDMPSKGYYTVKIGKSSHYYHESDVKLRRKY